jgi:hypothetical protein
VLVDGKNHGCTTTTLRSNNQTRLAKIKEKIKHNQQESKDEIERGRGEMKR